MKPKLIEILPPPKSPTGVPSKAQWRQYVSNEYPVPPDYIKFLEVYGVGAICDFIEIYSPISSNPHMNLAERTKRTLEALREVPLDVQLYPGSGGMLPISCTTNGDMLFWKTTGKPANWSIFVLESRASLTHTFEMSFTDFVYAILQHEIHCDIFPEDFPGERIFFRSSIK